MLYLLIAAILIAGDQAFKYWITQNVAANGTLDLIPGVIHLTYVQNTGAAFGMLSGMRWILVGVTAIAAVVMIVALFKMKLGFWSHLTLAILLGGAVGNGIDRAFNGFVVDMFELDFMRFAIFNVADCFITVGGILFCLCFIVGESKSGKKVHSAEAVSKEKPGEVGDLLLNDNPSDWTETKILESYELEQLLSKEDSDDRNGNA